MRLTLSLRHAGPISLAAMGLVLTAVQCVHDRVISDREIEARSLAQAVSLGHLAVAALERGLLQGDAAGVMDGVDRLALMPQLTLAVASDAAGRVLHATDHALRGRPLRDTPVAPALPLVERARATAAVQSEVAPGRGAVRVAVPFALAPLPGELRASRVGVLYTETDLRSSKREAAADVDGRSLLIGGVVLAACLLVWAFLRVTFARHLDRLVGAVEAYAAGGERRVPEEGGPELARIGRVVNQLLAELSAQHARLRESEERFSGMFRMAPIMAALSDLETGRFLEVNDESLRLTGFTRDELVGKTSVELGWFTPEERARVVSELAARGRVTGLDLHIRTRDGRAIECLFNAEIVTLGGRRRLLTVTQDIGERRRTERALRESEARFRLLAENSTDMISRHAPDGTYVYASPACRRILGFEPEELVGRNAYAWILPEDIAVVRRSHERVLSSPEVSTVTFRARRKDGAVVWVEGTSHVLRHPATGAVTEIQVALRDVSARVQAEEQQARLQALLIQAQKMEAVGHLAGGVAHDFNNILTAILMNADALKADGRLPLDLRDAIGELEDDARRAAGLTRQLLTFSRRQVMQVVRVELDGLLANLVKMLRRLIGEPIALELSGAGAPLWLQADAGMLEQAVTNLVVNARDAMPGGGRIAIRTRAVELDAAAAARNPEARPGPMICLEVSDDGQGMDPETARRAFEPFFTTKDVGKGTGLGLATVYGIAKQHEGWVELDTAPDRGTTFRLFFPAGPPPSARAEGAPDVGPQGAGERVLVVEDEPAVRRTVVRTLERLGYDVQQAASGAEALERWCARSADLLVSDMVMPGGMNGLELAHRLRQEHPGLKVILMSGYSPDLDDAEALLRAGMHHVPKPFEVRALAHRVREALDAR